jgi:CBS domain-containing protein
MQIVDVMVRDVVTIDASSTLVEAAERMREANVGVLHVLQDGIVRGVLTDRDLVMRAIAREVDPRTLTVGDCATPEPLVAHADWDTDQALELMARNQVGRLPVVDAEARPIGIVTLSSLALRTREDDEALAAAKEVSRRSAKGARGPARAERAGGGSSGSGRRPGQKAAGGRSHRAATRTEPGKRRFKRAG